LAEASAATNHSAPNNHAGLIWAIADLLRGDYKRSEYGRVILPLVLLRRLDCVLEPSRCCSQRLPDVPALSRPCAYRPRIRRAKVSWLAPWQRHMDNVRRRDFGDEPDLEKNALFISSVLKEAFAEGDRSAVLGHLCDSILRYASAARLG